MTKHQWEVYTRFRNDFKSKIEEWKSINEELMDLQRRAVLDSKGPEYPLETPIVYNTALDSFTEDDEIKKIVIGDNPGQKEQLNINQKYLVGLAGKIGEKFFREHSEFETDFRKNVIILNKTPIHTAKTNQIKYLIKHGSDKVRNIIEESQKWMAENTSILHKELGTELWLIGYSELKPKGLFKTYRETLYNCLKDTNEWNKVLVLQHFSMNCFTKDLKKYIETHPDSSPLQGVEYLGKLHRDEIFNI